MLVAIYKLLMNILLWILNFIDEIFRFFQALVGIDTVTIENGNETVNETILDAFLNQGAITKMFLSIFLLAVFLCIVCTVVAIGKNIINMRGNERKTQSRIIGQGLLGIGTTLFMSGVMILGITVANLTLGTINTAFLSSMDEDSSSIGQTIFDMSVNVVYALDYDNPIYKTENGELVLDEDGQKIFMYYDYLYAVDENGEIKRDKNGNKIKIEKEGYYEGSERVDIKKDNADTIFGNFDRDFGFEDIDDYVGGGKVRIKSFNFFIGFFGAIIMLIAICKSMFEMVKRLYDIVLLYLTLPVVMATIPLDDGAKFQQWRETVISKIFLAYGVIFSMNIFLMFMPIVRNIKFGDDFGGSVAKLFMIVGAGLAVNGGQLLFARLVGTSAEEAREMGQSARALIAGAASTTGIIMGAKNHILGGTNKYGRETKGILKGTAGSLGTATNVVGNVLGGNAYRSKANSLSRSTGLKMKSLQQLGTAKGTVHSNFANNGGVLGAIATSKPAMMIKQAREESKMQKVLNNTKGRWIK